jgi:alpha-N-acetylglucosaminidase
MKKYSVYFLIVFLFFVSNVAYAQLNTSASKALLQRIVPKHTAHFTIEAIQSNTGKDYFEIESKNNKIVLRGTSGVAIASALYHYLNEYCHAQITWNGENLKLPVALPPVKNKIQKQTPYEYRYYLNYCTFNYSMSWWDWKRWEKEIDWMALHGINICRFLLQEKNIHGT